MPSALTAMWSLMPRLPRSVGLGPVRSPARLARIEHVSRMSVGSPRSMATSGGGHLPQQARARPAFESGRSVEPQAMSAVAFRLSHGVPSRRKRLRVATTRTVATGVPAHAQTASRSTRSPVVTMRSRGPDQRR
jgi:hypothetical protein